MSHEKFDVPAIRARHDLLETIEKETGQHGKREGRWLKFKCPWHDDRDPSFAINHNRTYWQCFGPCNCRGDVIDFIMRWRKLDFVAACKHLGGAEADTSAIAEWNARRADERERETRVEAEKRAEFLATHVWDRLHDQMGHEQRAWWKNQGIPDDWQDYWCLGWTRHLWGLGSAFSIPFLDANSVPAALQYRIEHVNGGGKYRFQPELGSAAFIARPDMPLDKVLVVEGAKKAMVTHRLGTRAKLQVAGIPSMNADGGLCAKLAVAEKVWFLLDPEAWKRPAQAEPSWEPWPFRWARQTGAQARAVYLPVKIDDALLAGHLDEWDLRRLLQRSIAVPTNK